MQQKITLVVRVLFGLVFTLTGLDGFLHFMPQPEPTPEGAAFLSAMQETGYLFQFVKLTELVCGLAILAGLFVPLALVVIAPVVLNILLYHLFLDPSGLPLPIALLVLGSYLGWAYCESYKPMLRARVSPE